MTLDPTVPFVDKSGRIFRRIKDFEKKLAKATGNDMLVRLLQGADSILKVAKGSGKLQGQYRKLLNDAAEMMTLNDDAQ